MAKRISNNGIKGDGKKPPRLMPNVRQHVMSMIEQCKLCHTPDRLRRSHILSEFVYRALYDEHHRFFDLGAVGGKGVTFQQKGLREPLLCEHCERKLSTYEA